MSASSVLFAVRVDQEVKALVAAMASDDGITEALFIDHLVRGEARERKLVSAHDPGVALVELENGAAEFLEDAKQAGSIDEHVTRELFAYIQATPRLLKLHERAIRPPSSKIRPEKRRQYVHQRLGRFVKTYLKRRSLGEVLLAPGSGALIRGYTRLGK